ncbi:MULTISPECIES: SCP2 sterol-binding domain-containing protein [Micromonospora]|uniref:SCP2 sterol-binding domain-containing protein n=1 Tax=Micromonospora tulbaghiae TaxID=479978 RepID=A0A386WPW5_9ACTN|nr:MULTISPECIES: SCP2 sterol-binding domain-containing protein [Micromonospora]NED58836.1 SCP2 sterol-binding domain-containing protein [Micromonospora aurantiaca]AYF28654.1 sterol-binding protein [Micromonospora tulbaghiae]MBO4142911.1 SCP2 sterol-binding domain-containing protein [Micromonospora tulbaghiae]MCO1618303.1 SCP2 sterol-binding domain-containing protein [Micromonospora sp. CPM1]RLQ00749.1 sterol-binding protein [Micromonospora sp. BL1]
MSVSAVEHLARGTAGRHPELPETTSGTIRLDLRDDGHTEHWYLTIDRQDVRVERLAEEADLVVGANREVFDRIAAGRLHPAAALLRNDLAARGELKLLMTLRRIFPGPPDARDPRDVPGERAAAR